MSHIYGEILENKKGILYIDGMSATELANKCDTPVYIISERRIQENFRQIKRVLSKHYERIRIYYSAKANTNLSVLRILEEEGAWLDAVSPGEVFIAMKAGFPQQRILFTGTSVRDDELRYLSGSGVTINIDALSQLNRLLKFYVPSLLSVRVNPEVGAGHHKHCITAGKDSKFGIWEDDVILAYEIAKRAGVERYGIQMHIGSGILKVKPFLLAAEKMLRIARRVHTELGINFEFIDFGGGIGVPYEYEEEAFNLDLYAEKILGVFKKRIQEYDLGKPWFCIEPGRYLVCDAGVLLTSVNTIKITPYRKYIGVDAGFNTLIRPAMYGSHHPLIVANKLDENNIETYDIAGPICESGDLLARDKKLPKVKEGDLIAILNTGAYGFSMSSQYNSRPRCAEVMVNEGKYEIVREKETLETLLGLQKYPSWLNHR